MPFPNEHACRIVDPSAFQKDSFRRINLASGLDAIIGRKKGKTTTSTQAYRYDKKIWMADRARKHCSEKGGSFEQAEKGNEPMDEQKVKRTPIIFPILLSERGKILKEIHILPIGAWDHPLYGKIVITENDIGEFVENFKQHLRKGVPITEGHEVMDEKPAIGWITELFSRNGDGLGAKVQWTEKGKELLSNRSYKYFSPEFYREYEDPETREIHRNVLVGGALTNKPYFKELDAIVISSENIITNQFNEPTMDIETILGKPVADWTDEEKTFVKEHEADLTDEQKETAKEVLEPEGGGEHEGETEDEKKEREEKEAGDANEAKGLNRDGSEKEGGEEAKGSEKNKKGMVAISASELAILKTKANEGQQAFQKMKEMQISTDLSALTFTEKNKEGKFLPKTVDKVKKFMETLKPEQYSAFLAIMKEVPKTNIFGEVGSTEAIENSAQKQIEKLVETKMSEDKSLQYSDVLRTVLSENTELAEQYSEEVENPTEG